MANPLAFSTLACPEWTAETVIQKATAYGYQALEWRGGAMGHMPPSIPPARLAALARQQRDAGLFALAVTAYTSFVEADGAARQANFDELRRHCDVAAALGATYVRAFAGELPPGVPPASVHERVARGLEEAAHYAQTLGLAVALEPHDEFVHSAVIAPILALAPHPALSVIWDVGNAYSVGDEPADTFQRLRARLAYVQIKDGVGQGAAWRLTAVGDGEVPLAWAVEQLARVGFRGVYSVEWERAWHPELAPADEALPAARDALHRWQAAAAAAIAAGDPG
jgi:sugar phosphate isomerase/epimerase